MLIAWFLNYCAWASALLVQRTTAQSCCQFANSKELSQQVNYLASLKNRLPGSPNHNKFVNDIQVTLESLGLNVKSDSYSFTYFNGPKTPPRLVLADHEVHVNSYAPYSGFTDSSGVNGDLVELYTSASHESPEWQRAEGKIAVTNITDFPVSLDDFVRLWPQSPPWQSKQDLSFTIAESVAAHLSGAAEAGVKAVIYLWENTASNVADGLYAPFHQVYQGVPTIFVQRSAFAQALEAVSRRDTKVPATVVLDGDMVPNTETRSIWVVFEGTVLKNESIIITTHTDGLNIIEENGHIALMAKAKELIAHPPRRTTILLWATGHLHYKAFSPAPGKATTRWLNDHPEYWDGRGSQTLQHGGQLKAVAASCVEHLAAKDFPEPHSSWSSAKLSPEILLAATPELNQLVRKYWSGADPNFTRVGDPARSPRSQLGEGYPLFLAGIPEISLVTAPSHLLKAWPQEFDERQLLDLAALKRQICSFLRLWRIMDNMSATEFGSISLNGTQKPLHI